MATKTTTKRKTTAKKPARRKAPVKGRAKNGRFTKGNNIGVGRNPIFKKPEELEEVCLAYFEWADENPWIKNDVVRGGDAAGTPLQIPTQRPYTFIGLCQHLGISKECWKDYAVKNGFSDLCTRVRDKINNQQVEGALVGAFNASLTARIQGIADKKQHEGGDPSKPIHNEVVTKVVFEDYTKQKPSKPQSKKQAKP